MALTQKQKIGKVLQGLRENVTADDRKEYMDKFNRNKNTTSGYLNGTVYDIKTGMEMIEFFTARITARDKKLEQFDLQTT